jgi:hypothetical protein
MDLCDAFLARWIEDSGEADYTGYSTFQILNVPLI